MWGKREAESLTISVRKHRSKELGSLTMKELVETMRDEETEIMNGSEPVALNKRKLASYLVSTMGVSVPAQTRTFW